MKEKICKNCKLEKNCLITKAVRDVLAKTGSTDYFNKRWRCNQWEEKEEKSCIKPVSKLYQKTEREELLEELEEFKPRIGGDPNLFRRALKYLLKNMK